MTKVPWVVLCASAAILAACTRGGPATSEDTNAVLEPVRASIETPAPIEGGKLEFARANNVRYVGALRTNDGRHLRPMVLLRSGHLALVNDEGYAEMVRLGLKSVIDFRSKAEGRAAPDAPWVVHGTRHTVIELPEIVPNSAESYTQMLDALEPFLPKVFSHLGAPAALPALLHCGTGRGRACAAMAIVLLSLGVPAQEVANDFANNQEADADPRWLNGVFARVQDSGGIDAYLDSHGVSRQAVASLRVQALQ